MSNEELIILAGKISEGKATIAEISLYNAACEAFQNEEISWPGMEKDLVEMEKLSLEQLWASYHDQDVTAVKLWPEAIHTAFRNKFRALLTAAAAVAAIVFGIWFYTSNYRDTLIRKESAVVSNTIRPGKNGATITLANGKVIQLSGVKTGVVIGSHLQYNDGSKVQIPADASLSGAEKSMMLAATTARGQTYVFTLPDGTKAWLNADSKINFPAQFSGKLREITLNGEAYFEVTKDKAHPFVVRTEKQTVEVLGTHFNISAYIDEPDTKTTLLEGSVRVSPLTGTSSVQPAILQPDHQSIVNQSIRIVPIDTEQVIAWKNGEFIFSDESLNSIMKKIARWYDVEVVYGDAQIGRKVFGGSISRFGNVSDVLRMLELTGGVHFKVEGRRIIATK